MGKPAQAIGTPKGLKVESQLTVGADPNIGVRGGAFLQETGRQRGVLTIDMKLVCAMAGWPAAPRPGSCAAGRTRDSCNGMIGHASPQRLQR